jgi:hypothetical protein
LTTFPDGLEADLPAAAAGNTLPEPVQHPEQLHPTQSALSELMGLNLEPTPNLFAFQQPSNLATSSAFGFPEPVQGKCSPRFHPVFCSTTN